MSIKLTIAQPEHADKVYSAFASRKDLFPHIRKDYVQRQIDKGVVVFHKSVFIIFDEYKRRQRLGTAHADRGDIILHQIVNTTQGNGLASKVWDAWMKRFVADKNLVLTVRAANDSARKFYERKGMVVIGDISWSGGELPGAVYYLENKVKATPNKTMGKVAEAKPVGPTKSNARTIMKDWQKGIDINKILVVYDLYEKFNSLTYSRFASMGRDRIADCMDKNSLTVVKNGSESVGAFTARTQKAQSVVTMTKHAMIGTRIRGDLVIEAVTLVINKQQKAFVTELKRVAANAPRCWLHCWAEDKITVKAVEKAGFVKVGIKPKSTGELEAIYFRLNDANAEAVTPLHESAYAETITYSKPLLGKFRAQATAMAKRLTKMNPDFSTHPSGSNKDNTWSAISLRGYSKNILNIHDPDSAPASWVAEDKMTTKVVDTKLMTQFPEVLRILKTLGIDRTERIRFMRLTPGGGELTRHTDLISDKFGTHDSGIVRLHVPLITNPDVRFTMWDYNGDKAVFGMDVGDLCYLDARKPHSAINGGTTDRVHLVIDAYCTPKLRNLLKVNAG